MSMQDKYKKYYDALKSADVGASQGTVASSVNNAKNYMSSVKSAISSSSWTELATYTINEVTIPMIEKSFDVLVGNVSDVLQQVATKSKALLTALEALEKLEEEKDALGDKWSYNAEKTNKNEVDSHNSKIDGVKTRIDNKESEIDGIVSSLNSIEVQDVVAFISQLQAERKEKEAETTVTKNGNVKYSIPSDPAVAAKKAAFIVDYDDASAYTHYKGNNLFDRHNELTLFDNKTGEIISDLGQITMKPGETRVLTVKLPTDTGQIKQILRTTADGSGVYRSGQYVTARSDIDPDPNKIEYVRIIETGDDDQARHVPYDMSLTYNNCYDWIITADSNKVSNDPVRCSQSVLWTSEDSGKRSLKAMINLYVKVLGK